MMPSTLIRKVLNFARRPRFEQMWFVPAWLLLGASRFVILFVHFRRLAPYLGAQAGVALWIPLLDSRREARAMSISKVIRMAANYTPWTSNCFPQAVAARVLLGLYDVPYSIFFGINRDAADATLQAHAWVTSGRVHVTGGSSFDQFTVVGCFVAPGVASSMDQSSRCAGHAGTPR